MTGKIGKSDKAQSQTAIVTCPDCGEKLVLQGCLLIGVQVWCQNCEAELEVVNLAPVEVDGVPQSPEDEKEFLVRW
jgi:lysine biosynthesis protein LysW